MCFLQGPVGGLWLSPRRLLLSVGSQHDGGRSGNSHDPPAAGRSLCLRPQTDGGFGDGVRANQLTTIRTLFLKTL